MGDHLGGGLQLPRYADLNDCWRRPGNEVEWAEDFRKTSVPLFDAREGVSVLSVMEASLPNNNLAAMILNINRR